MWGQLSISIIDKGPNKIKLFTPCYQNSSSLEIEVKEVKEPRDDKGKDHATGFVCEAAFE